MGYDEVLYCGKSLTCTCASQIIRSNTCQAFENHENLLASLCKELSQIGDALPRIKLASVLFPTRRMELAITELYSYIIQYMIRSKRFYEESKIYHALHSITRPVELRFADLLGKIERCSQNVSDLAVAGAQAEQRDIHLELRELRELIVGRSHQCLLPLRLNNLSNPPRLSSSQFKLAS
jgi:hypothetical protein